MILADDFCCRRYFDVSIQLSVRCMIKTILDFNPVSLDAIATLKYFLPLQSYRTCDFSIGGIFMWADYFRYEYAVFQDTLFMKGVSEIDPAELAFSLPLGALPMEESIGILKTYCQQVNKQLVLSAVPEEAMKELSEKFACTVCKLQDWTDYLYDGEQLSTLPGSLYHKKRNHVSKYRRLYPNSVYERIGQGNLDEVLSFFTFYRQQYDKLSPIFHNEMEMTACVLENFADFGFIGAVLKVDDKIIGFTIGEVIRDTLYVHIEKADRSFDGVYETLNMSFARDILKHYPEVKYINREEDVGDEGLRKAKLSYHPVCLLDKYNLEFNN